MTTRQRVLWATSLPQAPPPAGLTWSEVATLPESKEEGEEPSNIAAGLQSWLPVGRNRLGGTVREQKEDRTLP